jgi:hypothetical protein
MRHSRELRLSALLALGAAVAVMFATAASAKQVVREPIHDEGTDVISDFCDVPGLTVDYAFVVDGRLKSGPHGRDRLDYFLEHSTVTEVFTNPANDKSITGVTKFIQKDLRVTDNGDGTLTVVFFSTGNAVTYGANGKAIARNPGQVRFELLVDHGGTPTDPSDDTEIGEPVLVKGSTGRSDDFCEAAVPALS